MTGSGESEEKELLELLKHVGISGYEAKAYLTLAKMGEATAPEIASRAGIPQPRVYEVLSSLLKKGLVEVRAGRPRTYRVLPPDIAMDSYVRRFVEDTRSKALELVTRLSKLYMLSSIKEREPLIWVNYNIDMGLERAKELVLNLKHDGFISADKEILNRLEASIVRRLKSVRGSVLAITVIGREDARLDDLMKLDRVEIRRLPTGVFRFVERDFSEAMIFGDRYAIHTREQELISIMEEAFYFACWRIAEVVKPIKVRRGQRLTLDHHWIAMDIIERAREEGLDVHAEIKGYVVPTREPVSLKGRVKGVVRVPDNHVRSIIIETPSGEVSVGGKNASVEKIGANQIKLVIV